jgi:hypothetical protein
MIKELCCAAIILFLTPSGASDTVPVRAFQSIQVIATA